MPENNQKFCRWYICVTFGILLRKHLATSSGKSFSSYLSRRTNCQESIKRRLQPPASQKAALARANTCHEKSWNVMNLLAIQATCQFNKFCGQMDGAASNLPRFFWPSKAKSSEARDGQEEALKPWSYTSLYCRLSVRTEIPSPTILPLRRYAKANYDWRSMYST